MTQHAQDRKRSDTLNMRIDPKVKYLAEKLARYQDKTLSTFIENAVRRALTDVTEDEPTEQAPMWGEGLWSEDEATRLFMLAVSYPSLLTDAQTKLWTLLSGSLIKDHGKFTLTKFKEYYDRSEGVK